MRNVPFIQYVYHFNYPVNSIDVRKMTDSELKFCIDIYNEDVNALCKSTSFASAKKLLEEHFPEYII